MWCQVIPPTYLICLDQNAFWAVYMCMYTSNHSPFCRRCSGSHKWTCSVDHTAWAGVTWCCSLWLGHLPTRKKGLDACPFAVTIHVSLSTAFPTRIVFSTGVGARLQVFSPSCDYLAAKHSVDIKNCILRWEAELQHLRNLADLK